jgi:hypothetical protein
MNFSGCLLMVIWAFLQQLPTRFPRWEQHFDSLLSHSPLLDLRRKIHTLRMSQSARPTALSSLSICTRGSPSIMQIPVRSARCVASTRVDERKVLRGTTRAVLVRKAPPDVTSTDRARVFIMTILSHGDDMLLFSRLGEARPPGGVKLGGWRLRA